jgi:hypothetical protein
MRATVDLPAPDTPTTDTRDIDWSVPTLTPSRTLDRMNAAMPAGPGEGGSALG